MLHKVIEVIQKIKKKEFSLSNEHAMLESSD